jgi:hypothetical protein
MEDADDGVPHAQSTPLAHYTGVVVAHAPALDAEDLGEWVDEDEDVDGSDAESSGEEAGEFGAAHLEGDALVGGEQSNDRVRAAFLRSLMAQSDEHLRWAA